MVDAVAATTTLPLTSGRRLLSGSAWALFAKATLALGALASNAIVARLLPPDQVGAYFLLTSLVAVASLAAQFGLQKGAVRLIAARLGQDDTGGARIVVRDTFALGAAFALPVAGVAAVAGAPLARTVFDSPAMAALSTTAALWIVARALQSLVAECFRGFNDLRMASLFGGIVQVVVVVGGLGTLWLSPTPASLANVVQVTVMSFGVGAGLGGWLLWRRTRSLPRAAGRANPSGLAAIAAPLGLASLIMFSLTQADVWIVGALLGAEPVALYGAAAKLVQLVAIPLVVVNSVVPPIIAAMHAQGRIAELEQVLRQVATLSALPALVVTIAMVFAGGEILGAVFGSWYSRGAPVLAVLAAGQALNVCSGSCGSVLIMTGEQRLLLAITAFTGLVALPATWAACRLWGVEGVALVMACALAGQNLAMLLAVRRRLGIWTFAGPGSMRGLVTLVTLRRQLRRTDA